MITTFLLFTSLLQGSIGLAGTKWTEIAGPGNTVEIECPIRLEFEDLHYKYINSCSGAGRNKVVEFGEYELLSKSVKFNNRRVVADAGSIFGDDPRAIEIRLVESDVADLAFEYDGAVTLLKKVD